VEIRVRDRRCHCADMDAIKQDRGIPRPKLTGHASCSSRVERSEASDRRE